MPCLSLYLEEGELLLRRKEIYEKLHPETKQHVIGGKARQNLATDTVSFAKDTAKKVGKNERSIRRTIQIAKNLAPETKEKIKEADAPTIVCQDQFRG